MSQMIYGVRLNPDRVPQSIINKVAGEEARAAIERTRREEAKKYNTLKEKADVTERNCNRLFADRMPAIEKRVRNAVHPASPLRRAVRKIGNGYALVVGTIMCIPEIGENLGLWVDERKEGNK